MDEDADSPKRYRKRAAELRAEAEKLTNAEAKKVLLDLAGNYEQLAKSLDIMARISKSRNSN